MKRHFCVLICILIIQSLLASGCTKANEAPLTIEKITDESNPSNIEYSFDGFYGELDGDTIAICDRDSIQIFDLKNNKLIKEIPLATEYAISGLDISGEIVAWAETNPKNIKKGEARNSEKEDSNIFIYNLKTNEKKQITEDIWAQSCPKVWKNYLIWKDNRDDNTKEYPGRWSLYLYDLNTGIEKKITSTLAAHGTYNICDDKIVWEDERNFKGSNIIRGGDNLPENNKDIYLYDIKTETESAVATGPYMESSPDVNGDYIAWEDRNSNTLEADIVLYDIKSKERFYLTKDKFDQGTPQIYGDYVVWMDERRGISTNDVIINGKSPNSDIVLYNIETKTERILTGDEPQIMPNISSEWVSFTLSRQVEPKVQIVKYKQ
jgi:beta propeller repeat protein